MVEVVDGDEYDGVILVGGLQEVIGEPAENAPDGWVPVQVATRTLGISRPTLLQRVKRGELRAVHIRAGRKKSLRIELPTPQDGLF